MPFDFERNGIEEALDQADVILSEGGIETVDGFGQHRVAEAIDDVGELGHDRGIDRDVEPVGDEEYVDIGLYLACELLEHEMLVLHLGAELRSLEQAFAIPDESVDCGLRGGKGCNVNDEPFVQEGNIASRGRPAWCALPAGYARRGTRGGRQSSRYSR